MATFGEWARAAVESIKIGGLVNPSDLKRIEEDRAFAQTHEKVSKIFAANPEQAAPFLAENLKRSGREVPAGQPADLVQAVAAQLHTAGVSLPQDASLADIGRAQTESGRRAPAAAER